MFVKVNIPVDKGIVPLVAALSCFEELMTLDSCEGSSDGEAYVSFTCGDRWQSLGEFVHRLSTAVGSRLDLCCGFSFRLEWFAGGEEPMAQVRVAPKHIQPLAAAIRAVAESELRVTPHMSPYSCGTVDKGPRS